MGRRLAALGIWRALKRIKECVQQAKVQAEKKYKALTCSRKIEHNGTDLTAQKAGFDLPGLEIARVCADSIANELGLVPGDRITEVNGKPLEDLIALSLPVPTRSCL